MLNEFDGDSSKLQLSIGVILLFVVSIIIILLLLGYYYILVIDRRCAHIDAVRRLWGYNEVGAFILGAVFVIDNDLSLNNSYENLNTSL